MRADTEISCNGCSLDAECDDGNECTVDTCVVETGRCVHTASEETRGRVCRRLDPNYASCDLVEFCDGKSGECPADRQGCDHDDASEEGDMSPMIATGTSITLSIGSIAWAVVTVLFLNH